MFCRLFSSSEYLYTWDNDNTEEQKKNTTLSIKNNYSHWPKNALNDWTNDKFYTERGKSLV